tara:strand:+ start:45 stop:512 length:468 start_codon:yes stop_codon:yes gene_type:complete
MKENLKPIQLANKIIKLSGINIFENTRKKNHIELRSLLIYLLREKLGMRWTNIANFFNNNNKHMNHATAIYACKNYNIYKKNNKKLNDIEKLFTFKSNLSIDEIDRVHYLENKYKLLQEKSNTPLTNLISKIPEHKHTEAIERIGLMIKSWQWKK